MLSMRDYHFEYCRGDYQSRCFRGLKSIEESIQERAVIHPITLRGLEALRSDPRCAEGTALADLISVIGGHLLVV
ncbi:hypothetical protein F5Y14DRAFT_415836 [Nemania sp. NC0429]|nr:hypothetical protein F5Y14DRAFT_415836 [Nemania sp. NC0429]